MTFDDARAIAKTLGNVEDATSYGTAALKVNGKLIARLKEDGDSLVVGTTFEEREEMLSADPDVYCITEHYRTAPWVLVRLSRVHTDALRDLLARSLRLALAAARPVRKPRKSVRPQ